MDYIKKNISIEGIRTRTQGLLPYFEIGKTYEIHSGNTCYDAETLGLETAIGKENGNWGQIVANPCFLVESGKTYNTMLQNYYNLLNMVRNGVKLRKVETKEGQIIFTEDLEVCGKEPTGLTDFAAYNSSDFYAVVNESIRKETRYIYRSSETIKDDFIALIQDYDYFLRCAGYLDGYLNNTDNEHKKWASYCDAVDVFIGQINVPASIYNEHIKVPKRMSCADVESYVDWLTNYPLSADCCNTRLWEDMGGKDMLEFLKSSEASGKCKEYSNIISELTYGIPYIEVPLLLTQNFTDVGVLTNVDGVEYKENDPDRPHNRIVMGQTREQYPTTEEYDENPSGYTRKPIVVESLLKTLRSSKKFIDDMDNVLPGQFQYFADDKSGKMFVASKSGEEWTINETASTGLLNGDGLSSEDTVNKQYYRSVTTKESAKRIAEVFEEETGSAGTFYFKAKYDNSSDKPMTIPYVSGNTANLYCDENGTCRGDILLSAITDAEQNIFEAIYAIGAILSCDENGTCQYNSGGDIYYEKYAYDQNHLDYVALDGVDNVPVWSQYIDFEGSAKQFYSPSLNLYRTGNTANIIEMTTGDIWNSGYSFDAHLTKEEYLTNFSSPPKVDIDVTIDRGGTSAFENHYKLAECNTIQDLEDYGNNFFNIQKQ